MIGLIIFILLSFLLTLEVFKYVVKFIYFFKNGNIVDGIIIDFIPNKKSKGIEPIIEIFINNERKTYNILPSSFNFLFNNKRKGDKISVYYIKEENFLCCEDSKFQIIVMLVILILIYAICVYFFTLI